MVEGHAEFSWDDILRDLASAVGFVLREDPHDGTMQVRFPPPLAVVVWLPSSVICDPGVKEPILQVPVTVGSPRKHLTHLPSFAATLSLRPVNMNSAVLAGELPFPQC